MKYFLSIIAILVSTIAYAQTDQFYLTARTPILTPDYFIAQYRIEQPPSQRITLYAWIGIDGDNFSAWKRDIPFVTLTPRTNTPVVYSAEFDIKGLGLVPGRKYSYAITNQKQENGVVFFNTPGAPIRECFTLEQGHVTCGPETTPLPTNFVGITSGEESAELDPVETGGISIDFSPNEQTIFERSAQLIGRVTTQLTMPVRLSFAWGKEGEPMGNEQEVLNLPELESGSPYPIILSFTPLEPDTAYSFVITNKITNTSQTRSFTTAGSDPNNPNPAQLGINPNSQSFNDPGGFEPVEDTISSKGIVPRCGRTPGPGVPDSETRMCGYQDFLQLISNIIQFGIIIVGPIIAILAMYTGVMIIWYGKSGDPTAQVMEALKMHKQRLFKIVIGIIIMISSYMIVATILNGLGVDAKYILLDIIK